MPGKRAAIRFEYAHEEREFDLTRKRNNRLFDDRVETHRARPRQRLFLPGICASALGTRFDQQTDPCEFHEDRLSPERSVLEQDFRLGDPEIGYRSPKRHGSVASRAFNFTDRKSDFFLSSLEQDVLPARRVLLNLSFAAR